MAKQVKNAAVRIEYGLIDDLKFDPHNANTGTEKGTALLRKSIQKTGIGRSVLAANDKTLIAGNQATEQIATAGFTRAVYVHTTGEDLVVVVRDDIAPNTKEFAEAALLDNNVSKKNLSYDNNVLEGLAASFDLDMGDLGFENFGFVAEKSEEGKAFTQLVFTLTNEQAEVVQEALTYIQTKCDYMDKTSENLNGNALAYMAAHFLTNK